MSYVVAIILRTCIPKIEEKIDCKSDYFHEYFFLGCIQNDDPSEFFFKNKNIDDFISVLI